MPVTGRAYDRKFHASAECWSLFEEVLAAEFQNAVLSPTTSRPTGSGFS